MRGAEGLRARKALSGLLGFLARGSARQAPRPASHAPDATDPDAVDLLREDGARRKADTRLLRLARSRGLLAGKASSGGAGEAERIVLTPEGRAALRRFLSDPDGAFQAQHRDLVAATDREHGRITVNAAESPLTALSRIKGRDGAPFLATAQVEAGERLRRDFTRGQMQPSLAQNWEPVRLGRSKGGAGGAAEIGEAALAARLRVERALAAVGPELSGVLLDVCCFLKGLADFERERQWPARSAKLMLRTALAALARHYEAPRPPLKRPPAPPPRAP